jgi:hypothetical protein
MGMYIVFPSLRGLECFLERQAEVYGGKVLFSLIVGLDSIFWIKEY